jgi:hypothetical protein
MTFEYKPNVKPLVIWVLSTRGLWYFKFKSVRSVITKCLFICSKSSFWEHPIHPYSSGTVWIKYSCLIMVWHTDYEYSFPQQSQSQTFFKPFKKLVQFPLLLCVHSPHTHHSEHFRNPTYNSDLSCSMVCIVYCCDLFSAMYVTL